MNQRDLFGRLAEGEQRKAEGQRQVLETSTRTGFTHEVQELIAEFARKGDPFTSTDLREEAARRGLSEPSHPNAWGAAVGSAAKRKVIRATGEYVKSTVPTCHAAVVAVWVGANHCRYGGDDE